METKEFQEIMSAFEKYAKQLVSLGSMGLEREPRDKWKHQLYYCDGNANNGKGAKVGIFGTHKAKA